MSPCLHSLTGIRLTAPRIVRSDHHTPVLFKVVTHFVSVPLVINGKDVYDRVLELDLIKHIRCKGLVGEHDVLCFADSPATNALIEVKDLAGFGFALRRDGEAVSFHGVHFDTCLCECVIGLHQLEVMTLHEKLFNITEAVTELLLGLQHQDEVRAALVHELVGDHGAGGLDVVIQA